jgi:hypothetical protein
MKRRMSSKRSINSNPFTGNRNNSARKSLKKNQNNNNHTVNPNSHNEKTDKTVKNAQDIEMIKSSLDYNPFYQIKFKDDIPNDNIIHNSNALLLLSKIKSDPSTYISNKMINSFIINQEKKHKHTPLTKEYLDEQAEIARDFDC